MKQGRLNRGLMLAGLMMGIVGTAPPPVADLRVNLAGLRSGKGVVRMCLTQAGARFMECKESGAAMLNVPAAKAGRVALPHLKPGTYALLVIHDENGNGKLDMTLGIPREGFGFSNNPTIHMRPPRAEEVRFNLAPGASAQTVRMRYVL
jgi:uncharacterized protein (DUF2141 family)